MEKVKTFSEENWCFLDMDVQEFSKLWYLFSGVYGCVQAFTKWAF